MPSPSPSPSAERYLTLAEANAAFAREDYSTALRLYRRAASDESTPPGPDLRAFARFRIVVADAIVGQDDDARAILEEMRQKDLGTPFPRLALVFWDTYGMTADVRTACNQVTRIVEADPERYLRSLRGSGSASPDPGPGDVCQIPPS